MLTLAMGEQASKPSFRENLAVAGGWFNAWWEGYEFDLREERERIRANLGGRRWRKLALLPPDVALASALWAKAAPTRAIRPGPCGMRERSACR